MSTPARRAQMQPARVILEWIDPHAAVEALAERRRSEWDSPEPPEALRAHEAKLAEDPRFAPILAAGTRVALYTEEPDLLAFE